MVLYNAYPCPYCNSPKRKRNFATCDNKTCKELAVKDRKINRCFTFTLEESIERNKNRGVLTEFGKKVIRDDYKPPK